jgi:hypothetical protein
MDNNSAYTLISSQRHRNASTIACKRREHVYTVTLSPSFCCEEKTYRVLMDGHHSYVAALADGIMPHWQCATTRNSSLYPWDTLFLLTQGDIAGFLAAIRIDSPYYDLRSGRDIDGSIFY